MPGKPAARDCLSLRALLPARHQPGGLFDMPKDREGPIQASIVQWLRLVLPPECIVHFAKGEINKRGKAFMIEQARATRLGALKGFPDLVVIPFACVGVCFFEVKAEGNYTTQSQKDMHEKLRALGYNVAVVRSIEDARDSLREWGVGFREG